MNDILHSPFAVGVCLLTLIGWVGTVSAIFWPRKNKSSREDERDTRF